MSNFETEILQAVKDAVKHVYDIEPDEKQVVVETPRDPKMGDYSTSVAMRLAKQLHKAPMMIAEPLVEYLKENYAGAESVELANPGFINFRMKASALSSVINKVLEEKEAYGTNNVGNGEKVLVEYVSANPTGNLHCGHARGAAWGDALTRILKVSGYDVLREYYVNDAGHQIDMLAESIYSRYCELYGISYPLPEEGYHAADIVEVAKKIQSKDGDKWLHADEEERTNYFKDEGIEMKLDAIREDLDLFRVHFDSWMHERFFYENNSKRIEDVLEVMKEKDLTYEAEGALWFKSSKYGDDKDRVLRKSTGLLTYLTPDIANHVYKFERGYDTLIDLWGADHHSYVIRMKCALEALGYKPEYYAQYAYSRMNSIVTREDVPSFEKVDSYDLLTEEKELQMLKLISEFPQEVANAAKSRKPNHITDYIISLVKVFHSYYNACRVYNPENLELTNQRLGLIHATMITLKNALDLVGVTAPEKM